MGVALHLSTTQQLRHKSSMAAATMRSLSLLALLLCAIAAHASPVDPYGEVHHEEVHHKGYKPAPKPYSFSYGVEDPHYGPNFQQSEKSDGKNVDGGYTVHLPDGRIQKVTYTADHVNGFHANVEYKGKAQYPSKVGPPFIVKPHKHEPHHEPSYAPVHEPSYETVHEPAYH